jgi:hypothetical protein
MTDLVLMLLSILFLIDFTQKKKKKRREEYRYLDKTTFILIYYPSHLTIKLNPKKRQILGFDTGNKTDDHKTLIHYSTVISALLPTYSCQHSKLHTTKLKTCTHTRIHMCHQTQNESGHPRTQGIASHAHQFILNFEYSPNEEHRVILTYPVT